MLFPIDGEVIDPETGEVLPGVAAVLPSHFKCPQTGASLPVENPAVWVYPDGRTPHDGAFDPGPHGSQLLPNCTVGNPNCFPFPTSQLLFVFAINDLQAKQLGISQLLRRFSQLLFVNGINELEQLGVGNCVTPLRGVCVRV